MVNERDILRSLAMNFELPCDVRLPPNTVIGAGCKLETLILALELAGRPRHFAHPPIGDPT